MEAQSKIRARDPPEIKGIPEEEEEEEDDDVKSCHIVTRRLFSYDGGRVSSAAVDNLNQSLALSLSVVSMELVK